MSPDVGLHHGVPTFFFPRTESSFLLDPRNITSCSKHYYEKEHLLRNDKFRYHNTCSNRTLIEMCINCHKVTFYFAFSSASSLYLTQLLLVKHTYYDITKVDPLYVMKRACGERRYNLSFF
jgi:hypothetical protein